MLEANIRSVTPRAESLLWLPDPHIAGRICALSTQVERAVRRWASGFPRLIEENYISPVTAAFAYAAPWSTVEDLLLPLEFELWVFAVDKMIDTDARSLEEVESLVQRILHASDGRVPASDDQPALALADIVKRLAGTRLWPALGERWRELMRITFEGMIVEWRDSVALANGNAPSFERYIENSDSCAFRIIRLTSWVACGDPAVISHLDDLMAAAWDAEISSRLTNDLRSWEREQHATDLNALKLGVSEDHLRACIRQATENCTARLEGLLEASSLPAIMLDRILAFGNGFYGVADFRDDYKEGALLS